MTNTASDNRRIAKNTVILYGRMLIMVLIGLYTSRIVLNALGVEDYGINAAVGGFTGLFAVVSQTMSSTISRYLTFELGKGEQGKLSRVFSTSVNIQIVYSIIIFILAETIGLWFVNEKMVIPSERMFAANIIYQLSILNMVLSLICVPYDASIVAHEKMSIYAYITLYEVVGKLLVVFLLYLHLMDNLILFGILCSAVLWTKRSIYLWYCKRNFPECTYHWIIDKQLIKKMFGFAGWNLIGSSSAVLRDQGSTILINLFFGPAVNAARGIADTVMMKVLSFVSSFTTAINPQITKLYATGENEAMIMLIHRGSSFSFYLMYMLVLPILLNTDYLLNLWLGIVPEHTVWLVRLILVFSLFESLSYSLVTASKATGNIRNYQLIVGGLQLLNLPLCYGCFKLGYPVETHLLISIMIGQLCLFARIFVLKNQIGLQPLAFFKNVYFRVLVVSLLSLVLPVVFFIYMNECFARFVLTSVFSLISICMTVYFLGCSNHDRTAIRSYVKSYYQNHINRKQ